MKSKIAALILGCSVAALCLPAVADQPTKLSEPEVNPVSLDPIAALQRAKARNNPKAAPSPTTVRPQSDKERQVYERIRAGWDARHERIRTLYIAWVTGPGDRPDPNSRLRQSRTELWIDGDLRRRTLTSLPRNAEPYFYAFDGMTSSTWDPERHQGEVWSAQGDKRLVSGYAPVWLLAVDPVRCELIDFSSPDVKVQSDNAIIGDRHCVKVRFPMMGPDARLGFAETLWVDPARDNVVVGWDPGIVDAPGAFLSIEYSRDKQYGWLPTRWHQTAPSAALERSGTASRIAINEQYPISLFRPTFPAGALVRDRNLSQWYEIAADGSKTRVGMHFPLKPEPIDAALNRTTDFVVDPEPLKDALEFIAQRYHIKTAIDEQAVRQGLIEPTALVETQKHGIKLKELLDLLLKQSPKPLRYEIRNDVMTVVAGRNSAGNR